MEIKKSPQPLGGSERLQNGLRTSSIHKLGSTLAALLYNGQKGKSNERNKTGNGDDTERD